MLEAMQPSSDSAPAALARPSTSTWTAGLIVAQLMNTRPSAPVNRLSPSPAKMVRIEASSITTVMMTSDNSVTCTKVLHAVVPNSSANSLAASLRMS